MGFVGGVEKIKCRRHSAGKDVLVPAWQQSSDVLYFYSGDVDPRERSPPTLSTHTRPSCSHLHRVQHGCLQPGGGAKGGDDFRVDLQGLEHPKLDLLRVLGPNVGHDRGDQAQEHVLQLAATTGREKKGKQGEGGASGRQRGGADAEACRAAALRCCQAACLAPSQQSSALPTEARPNGPPDQC